MGLYETSVGLCTNRFIFKFPKYMYVDGEEKKSDYVM